MTIQKPPKLPDPSVRLVNKDGTMAKDWYDWFRAIDTKHRQITDAVNDHETRITELEP